MFSRKIHKDCVREICDLGRYHKGRCVGVRSLFAELAAVNSSGFLNYLPLAIVVGAGHVDHLFDVIFYLSQETIDEEYMRGVNIIRILELVGYLTEQL